MTTHTPNRDRTVAVATDYYWLPIATCPLHQKVQLLTKGGIATYGKYDGKDKFFKAWAPLPRKPKEYTA